MFASSFQFERSIAKAITGRVLRIRYTVSRLLSASEKEEQEKQQEPKSKGSATNQPEISEGDMKIVESFRAHQKGALRPSMAEEARTLIENSSMFGVLSANSDAMPGYPTGSVVGFDMDVEGKPFFVFSTLAAHIKDVLKDSRTSLTVMAADFKGASEGRATITGDIVKVTDEAKRAELREKYLSRHKDAYWVDFGDFSFFHMQSIQNVRYVGGFAMIGNVTSDQFLAAKPDPLAAFAVPVIKHMNEDHEDALISMVRSGIASWFTSLKLLQNTNFINLTHIAPFYSSLSITAASLYPRRS
jgi:putative heme iron utilization protein